MDNANIPDIDGRAADDLKRDIFNILKLLDITAAAHEILRGSDFEKLSSDIGVRHPNLRDHVAQRNAVGDQLVWIKVHLVLLHKAADRSHFSYTFDRFER